MVVNNLTQSEINKREAMFYPYRLRPFHFNLSVRPVTGKFYARHDYLDFSAVDPDIVLAIEKFLSVKNRYAEPVTTNMAYGWYTIPVDLEVRQRFNHPKVSSWVTRIGAEIARQEQKIPKNPFKGIPFMV